jgi:response regulator RpfG family c-di-GMP phosphodiesterase
MPEESGVRAYRDLTSSDKTKHIPIIIITGVTHDFKGFIESRRQVPPPVAYFEKPIDREKLLVKVKELIAGRE